MGKRKRSGSFSKYDDCSKKSDDGDSQEEMDGDPLVVQKGNIANGIRYSARVQEKLRRESSPSKQTIADATSTVPATLPCQSTIKVAATVGEESVEVYPIERTFISQSINIPGGEKKKKRTWELWSQEDKQLFFEALNEFGKDFDAIQNYLASKLKPRSKGSCSQALPKNKDQVRHFYYRTWNKISKYLTFPKDMKKAYQELYGLINYGELRKKQRVLNLKTAVKLSELVEKGTTTIKVRGKTFRIKTPVCRALKKLNQLDDIDHIRVPCKLCVELVPHDGNTWTSVQRVSHNPRVKVFVPLQRTLGSLIMYFEERWKTDQNRLKEEFSLTVFGKPRTRLRFYPVESRDLSVPVFKFSEVTSATKISLSSYVQNCLSQDRKQDCSLVSKKFKRKPKIVDCSDSGGLCSGGPNRDADYLAAEADVSDVDGCEATPLENQFRITLRRDKLPQQGGSTNTFGNGMRLSDFCVAAEQDNNSNGFPPENNGAHWSVHEENANAAAETDAGETDYGFDENVPSPTECDDNTCDEDMEDGMGFHDQDIKDEKHACGVCSCKPLTEEENGEKLEKQCTCGGLKRSLAAEESIKCQILDLEAAARGWDADEAGALTLGEIYLMLGKADKLCFEYTWDKCDEDKLKEERARNLVDRLVNTARQFKKKKTNRAKISSSQQNPNPSSSGTAALPTNCNSSPVTLCTKCSSSCQVNKSESPGSVETSELPLNVNSASTTNATSSVVNVQDSANLEMNPSTDSEDCSPSRLAAPAAAPPPLQSSNLESLPDDNKITLHVALDSGTTTDTAILTAVESLPKSSSSPKNQENQETQTVTVVEFELEKKDESTSTQGLLISSDASVITSGPSSDPTPIISVNTSCSPTICTPVQQHTQLVVTNQQATGSLIDITALTAATTNCSATASDMDSNFVRIGGTNIQTIILPSPDTVTSSALVGTCHQTGTTTVGISPVATTVIVGESTMFAGIATETASFVTIPQPPCSVSATITSVVDHPSTSTPKNTQEPKFRRPADVPILMKPPAITSGDDRSTNEDGSAKLNVPKPFLDLPKGNRRIGRRPAWKQRFIIPRMLPLLPKPDASQMATLIAIPPVVATGLSVVPCSTDGLTTVTTLPVPVTAAEFEATLVHATATAVPIAVSSILSTTVTVSPTLATAISENTIVTSSSLMSGGVASIISTSCATASAGKSGVSDIPTDSMDKSMSRNVLGLEETLDNFSLSSFMDISIPESTRFIASDMRFDELECSNSSTMDETSRKNARDPPLLSTPKKRIGGSDDVGLDSPDKLTLTTLEAWNAMNEGMDFSMGSLFNGNEGLRSASTEPLSDGDLNFQSVIGVGSLDFESKLNDFAATISDNTKQ